MGVGHKLAARREFSVIPVDELLTQIETAVAARSALFDEAHETAFRLFNGFVEGCPDLVIDLYAQTAVVHNYAKNPTENQPIIQAVQTHLRQSLPWLQAILLKTRQADSAAERNGILIWGTAVDTRIREQNVRYALNLTMNQDCSFYLDTRHLRRWILDNLAEKRVLNTFAYTGSLGVAAMAAGASQVIHVDRNRQFLNLAKDSYSLNGFGIDKKAFISGDFFPVIKRLNRQEELFDCIFLDPPFFSATKKGTVDTSQNMTRLINKLRPLVKHNGRLVTINNALFVSGQEYIHELEQLGVDGYVEIETIIPIAKDYAGYPETQVTPPISDPTPFNHATKIAILRIQHKQN